MIDDDYDVDDDDDDDDLKHFYTQTTFTHALLHTETFTHKYFY